jgi:hypothetical protein
LANGHRPTNSMPSSCHITIPRRAAALREDLYAAGLVAALLADDDAAVDTTLPLALRHARQIIPPWETRRNLIVSLLLGAERVPHGLGSTTPPTNDAEARDAFQQLPPSNRQSLGPNWHEMLFNELTLQRAGQAIDSEHH